MICAEIGFPGLVEGVGQIGIVAALLCFFVWQSSKEKAALSERIADVENFQRDELSGLVKDTTHELARSTNVVSDNNRVMEKLCAKIDGISHNGEMT